MTKSKLLLAALLACLLAPVAALAETLPDLGGKKVVV
ncbi:MAG: basic amino acid ABC transporter substrate-binding protein, partial [Mesorhizobium sp.]